MATAKKAANGAAKTGGSRALTLWEQDMAEAAKRQAQMEKPFGAFKSISFRGGIMSVDDSPVPGNEMNVLIVCSAHENQWFDRPYNPDVPAVPACYAFGDLKIADPDELEDAMVPHEEAKDKQAERCADCELNVMGSADVGKGKACKNVRRLAVMTEDAAESADAMKEAEVRMIKVPVMSVKGWVNYVRTKLTDELNKPYWAVITKVKCVPDAKSQFRILFEFEREVEFTDAIYKAFKDRLREVEGAIVAPYPELEDAPPPPARGRQQPVRPQGRMAEKMAAAKTPAKPAAGGARKAKY